MDIYADAGVNYDVLDAGKRAAVAAALTSTAFSHARGATGNDQSRGEPAFVFELSGRQLAIVLECLGTKSTIARRFQEETGRNRFADVGYDAVSAIVNDIICVGALPLVVNAYFATGSPDWYSAGGRFEALVEGWLRGCDDSGATWGGGESPGLSGIVEPSEIDLAGSGVGAVPEGAQPIYGRSLDAGDEIVLVASSGLHTNGASLVRKLVGDLPNGYATALPSGALFGDAVLEPSVIYVKLVEALLSASVPVTYFSNVTGHGFRKLMRADRALTYRITSVPDVPEVLQFMVDQIGLTPAEAYGTFNMGAGFAVYVKSGNGEDVVRIAKELEYEAWVSGYVEAGPKQVIVDPIDVVYTDADLQLR
jgi:phosphoribosylformylglycinamidine cyclo-ligase